MAEVEHSAVARFAADRVNLPSAKAQDHRGQVNRLRTSLEQKIAEDPGYALVKMLHAGSVAKGTALKTVNDLDVAVYVKQAGAPVNDAQLVPWLADRLFEAAPPNMTRDQFVEEAHCVTVSYKGSGLDVDVVPVLYEGASDDVGLLVDRHDGSRLITSITLHLRFIRDRKQKYGTNFAELIRLTKWWRRQATNQGHGDLKFKSFMIELLWAHLADGGLDLSDYPTALESFFQYVVQTEFDDIVTFTDFTKAADLPSRNSSIPIEVIDPVNPANNVATRYDHVARGLVELSSLPREVTAVQSGATYDGSTGARILRSRFIESGGLAVPATAPSPMLEYAGVYMVLDDYFGLESSQSDLERVRRSVIDDLVLQGVPRDQLLLGLGILTRTVGHPDRIVDLTNAFRLMLHPEAAARFMVAIESARPPRAVLARQTLLGAFREVLRSPGDGDGPARLPPPLAALLLTHAVAAGFSTRDPDTEDQIGGVPAQLAVDLVTNFAFNSSEDLIALLDRTLRLWRDLGGVARERLGGPSPAEILTEVTGLELEDLLAMAFAVMSHRMSWSVGEPVLLNPGLHPGMDRDKWSAFLDLVGVTPDEMADRLTGAEGDWDYLAFQAHPVLRLDAGLLLIDSEFLLQRVTNGLYWLVHDHLRGQSDALRQTWTQVWGDMVEALAEEELVSMAPPVLGGGTTYYTEDDLAAAYGEGSPRVDAVIDFGVHLGAFEIVSGQLTTGTRVRGEPAAFRADLEKIVFKKARQLSGSCANLVADDGALTGVSTSTRYVVPVLVAGGGFPVNQVTMNAIREYVAEMGLFDHARIYELSIIDLGELEMLEGLAGSGSGPIDLILRWRRQTWVTYRFATGSFASSARAVPSSAPNGFSRGWTHSSSR